MKYRAKEDYQSIESARSYEQRPMYSGFLGKRRIAVENAVINQLSSDIEPDSRILDCPCGNGRWFAALSQNAKKIVGLDASTGMVEVAGQRAKDLSIDCEILHGDAENLSLPDDSVDYVFSYALMKHIPVPVQYKMLSEFARVAAKGVICSFAVFTPFSYIWWRRKPPFESYPVVREELDWMARGTGLVLQRVVKVSQPLVGLEHFAVFSKSSREA